MLDRQNYWIDSLEPKPLANILGTSAEIMKLPDLDRFSIDRTYETGLFSIRSSPCYPDYGWDGAQLTWLDYGSSESWTGFKHCHGLHLLNEAISESGLLGTLLL